MTQTNGNAIWVRIAAVVLPLLVAALVAYGMIRSETTANERAIGRVETQAAAQRSALEQRMEVRLMRIEDKLDRLLELRLQP